MSNTRLLSMTPATSLSDGDPFYTDQGGDRQGTMAQIAAYFRTKLNAFVKTQSVVPFDLTSGTTISVDASQSNNFRLDLAHNGTLANPTNLTDGMVSIYRIKNTGSFTLAFGSKYKFAGGSAFTLTTGAGKVDIMSTYYDGDDDVLYCFVAQDLH